MTIDEAIRARHSVRQYTSQPVEEEKLKQIKHLVEECNREGGLHFQVVSNEPEAFSHGLAKYGKFSGVRNYVALIAPKGADEQVGYYGERLVLEMQRMGLNSCWVALTFKNIKTAYSIAPGEKLHVMLPFGYGENQGHAHKVKSFTDVVRNSQSGDFPDWFRRGVEFALLAPTAINQQKFRFALLSDGRVQAEAGSTLLNSLAHIDLGIAKYHFEVGAAPEGVRWA